VEPSRYLEILLPVNKRFKTSERNREDAIPDHTAESDPAGWVISITTT
jgi:hypothetical protein